MEGDLQRVFEVLGRARVRYLVVGGVAVVLHGHLRFTADLDLVIALDPDNVRAAVTALATLGYRPRAPVSATDLADPAKRREWIEDKGLTVLSFWSPQLPATELDVFVDEPFPFDAAHGRSVEVSLGASTLRVASLADMIAMKRIAGRPQDLADIEALEAIAAADEDPDG